MPELHSLPQSTVTREKGAQKDTKRTQIATGLTQLVLLGIVRLESEKAIVEVPLVYPELPSTPGGLAESIRLSPVKVILPPHVPKCFCDSPSNEYLERRGEGNRYQTRGAATKRKEVNNRKQAK